MSKDFSEVYQSKEYPDSEPIVKLENAIFCINKVEYLPSQYGGLALVYVGDNIYRTSSEVLYEQLAFVKRSIEEDGVTVNVKLVRKTSFIGREYLCFVSAMENESR